MPRHVKLPTRVPSGKFLLSLFPLSPPEGAWHVGEGGGRWAEVRERVKSGDAKVDASSLSQVSFNFCADFLAPKANNLARIAEFS